MAHIADEQLVVTALYLGTESGHAQRCATCAAEAAAYRRIARLAAGELRRQHGTGVLRRIWLSISQQSFSAEHAPNEPGPGGVAA